MIIQEEKILYFWLILGRMSEVATTALDSTPAVSDFARKVEASVIETIEEGTMTKDLTLVCDPPAEGFVTTEGFIKAVRTRLERKL